MKHLPAILSALAFVLTGGFAHAGLLLSVDPAAKYGNPGAAIVFSGVLVNTSTTDKLFLNDVQVALSGASATHLTLNRNTFFAHVPGILLPGETYSGPVFSILLASAAPLAAYPGTITVLGGAGIHAVDPLNNAAFTVQYTPMELWRFQKFGILAGDASADDTGDWDHDTLNNRLEYMLGADPRVSSAAAIPHGLLLGEHLAVEFVPSLAAATELAYVVEASTDLTNWSSDSVELVTLPDPDPPGRVTYRYVPGLSSAAPVFLRLRVTRPDAAP